MRAAWSRWPWRIAVALLLAWLLADGASAQWPGAVPPPPTAAEGDEPLTECVPRYGNAGCAARLYAQVLCDLMGSAPTQPLARWQGWLERRFSQAGIRFEGLTAEQIEQRAVEEQAPELCAARVPAIRSLFSNPAQP